MKWSAMFVLTAVLCSGISAAQEPTASKSNGKSNRAAKTSDAYTQASAAKAQFMRETGYRNGRPGYVVAYRKPPACGGADDISNMEWLTVAEAKAKAQSERKGCK